jgi:hypothetical protein
MRVSLDWAALIARIYEANPLICSSCGGKIKIIGFVDHATEIHLILPFKSAIVIHRIGTIMQIRRTIAISFLPSDNQQ